MTVNEIEIEQALRQADDLAISEEVDCSDVLSYIERLKEACQSAIKSFTRMETLYKLKCNELKSKEQAECKGEIVELIANVGDRIYVPWTFDGQDGIMRLKVLKIDITKSNVNYCTDLGTDSDKFYLAFSRGEFNQNDYNKIWFIDKSEAERRLAELKGEE